MPGSFPIGSAEVAAESNEVLLAAVVPIAFTFTGSLSTLAQGTVDARTEDCPLDIDVPVSSIDITAGGEIDIRPC